MGQGPGKASSKKRSHQDEMNDEQSQLKSARVADKDTMTVDKDNAAAYASEATAALVQDDMLKPCPHLAKLSLSKPDTWINSAKRMVTVIVSQFSRATVTTVTPVTTRSSPSDSPHQSGHFEPLHHTKHPHTPMDLCGHTSALARPHPQTSPFDGSHVCLYGLEYSLVHYCLTSFTTDPCICLTVAIMLPSCRCQLPPLPLDLPKVPACHDLWGCDL
jgi:hypothetical protein